MSSAKLHTTPQLERLWISMIQSPLETLSELDKLISEMPKTAPEYETAIFYRGSCLIFTADYRGAIQQLNEALDRAVLANDLNQIRRVNNALGMAYKSTGEYGQALKALETAIELSKKLNDVYGQFTAQLNLADLFFETHDYSTCEQHVNEVTGLDHSHCDEESIAELYWQQARIFLLHMDFNSAAQALKRTFEIAVKIDYVHLRIFSLILKGRMYRLMGDLSQAETILEAVINDPNLEFEGTMGLSAYIELAKALFSDGNQQRALTVINLALNVNSDGSDHAALRLQVYELAAFCYQAAGDIEKANRYFQLTLELERSVVNQRNRRAMELSKARLQQENQKIKQEIIQKENTYLKNEQSQLQTINKIAIRLAETLSLSALGERLYGLLSEYLDAHVIALSENDPEQSRVVFRTFIDDGTPLELYEIRYDEPGSNTVLAAVTGKPVSINEPSKKRKLVGKSKKVPNSQLFLPLKNKDDVIGVLSIQSEIPNRFTGSEYKLILAIAPFISLAFSNALSHEKLQKLNRVLVQDKKEIIAAQEKIEFLALHDPLTEMPNRRALTQYIDTTIANLQPNKFFSLAYIDLDKFKPVNDQFGHKVGDKVLQIVAERINSVLRSSDFSARVGGDEFVLVIDHIDDKTQLKNMCNRILESIEKPISVDSHIINISASIGVVDYQKHGINLDTLIHNADVAMYEIKNSSKGGVLLAS
ncbi:diguanylate cyclase [Reinekea marina]|uniref:Diguanylate cyclase domain-containing protein n=1 Tax=Reinekea marina TaxID=1310421 RepID=A0ABV7WV07_9GAMM|nr:diguanylate cyclase [Reinekea marina]MDN3647459.1 diguanylate cyclase [Reinekea marina]